MCDIMTENSDCYSLIKGACEETNFIHIKIPQQIHDADKNRANHGGPRHIEI